ncbi:phenylacetic acid degradation protein [Thermosyntropha lipolytica DSM 11003]|uniref:Phenylacetic acid degradation protein n=1 Tax=Thermosyntropha lipolytica DSM 11003 TaxID=1123382 RepID=A0A1M5P4U3_9FIRM|nr:gamma carbonic anhydrase family protein [Thermosyntropha lipolytica]SHG96755.1 phenylacetic acid degradation protein [Thermosyntropha lipolytica DSM 11003]
MPLYEFEGKKPVIGENSFVHPQATVIGEVIIGKNCYIAAGTVLRGDYGKITIGDGSNIQDNAVLHAEPGTEAVIAENVLIGHSAIVHGPCYVGEYAIIGMGAIVNNGCRIEPEAVLAAGSLLPPGKTIPSRKIAMGNPAKVVKDVDENMLNYNKLAVKIYQDLAQRSFNGLKPLNG